MAKACNDDVLDGMLDIIALSTIMTVCNAQPTTRIEAVTTFALADVVMAGGDYVNADGDVSGRKVTVATKTGVTVDTSGTATHVSLSDATRLLYVTTCTSQVLTSGNTVDFPAWDVEVADPV